MPLPIARNSPVPSANRKSKLAPRHPRGEPTLCVVVGNRKLLTLVLQVIHRLGDDLFVGVIFLTLWLLV
jgi:hypothetical protein